MRLALKKRKEKNKKLAQELKSLRADHDAEMHIKYMALGETINLKIIKLKDTLEANEKLIANPGVDPLVPRVMPIHEET
ncbi:hypothetical protein R1flu_018387 [Riccia fluitans]|uniref:Uncharacterized protein n=1 Tax=Riccia fluitans TaxID=41844 RepID=A0ABD1ZJ55_9MARC